ncbi:MAG: hypothetical protein CM1200mP3_11640 [Chloroflexota bacterium]|nr:MAG: hypothetical protein CM1200mP3_11640 [Chloroflexota bacterium]
MHKTIVQDVREILFYLRMSTAITGNVCSVVGSPQFY